MFLSFPEHWQLSTRHISSKEERMLVRHQQVRTTRRTLLHYWGQRQYWGNIGNLLFWDFLFSEYDGNNCQFWIVTISKTPRLPLLV